MTATSSRSDVLAGAGDGDESVDRFGGVLLDLGIVERGGAPGLVGQRSGDLAGRAGVEDAGAQLGVGDPVDQALGADLELVGEVQARCDDRLEELRDEQAEGAGMSRAPSVPEVLPGETVSSRNSG
jgi:hypothetical protein